MAGLEKTIFFCCWGGALAIWAVTPFLGEVRPGEVSRTGWKKYRRGYSIKELKAVEALRDNPDKKAWLRLRIRLRKLANWLFWGCILWVMLDVIMEIYR